MQEDYKSIPVKPETYESLYARKRATDTWDDTLTRLLDGAEVRA